MDGSGNLKGAVLVELERRVKAHQAAIETVADALDDEPSDEPIESSPVQLTGISNRESARDEAQERQEYPPLDTSGNRTPRLLLKRVKDVDGKPLIISSAPTEPRAVSGASAPFGCHAVTDPGRSAQNDWPAGRRLCQSVACS
jgi:hypothetical protein